MDTVRNTGPRIYSCVQGPCPELKLAPGRVRAGFVSFSSYEYYMPELQEAKFATVDLADPDLLQLAALVVVQLPAELNKLLPHHVVDVRPKIPLPTIASPLPESAVKCAKCKPKKGKKRKSRK